MRTLTQIDEYPQQRSLGAIFPPESAVSPRAELKAYLVLLGLKALADGDETRIYLITELIQGEMRHA